MMKFEETMENAAAKDREAGQKLMAEKKNLEEGIKFFMNALKALDSATFTGVHAKHIGALQNLLAERLKEAQAEYEGKFSMPQFGKQPEAVGVA